MSLLRQAPSRAPMPAAYTQCLSWRLDENVCALRCWSPAGTEITLCGHGLLCCGAAWRRFAQPANRLEMNDLQAAFREDDRGAWIGLPSISCAACPVPPWTTEFFSAVPWCAAVAGDDDGYLVLEWPQGFDLRSLPVPDYALRHRTRRAVIVTSKNLPGVSGDVQLRYFAPQHGVPEDTATGSAMRVLASYWMNRGCGEQLRAHQCSGDGGALQSLVSADITWVGGRVLQRPLVGVQNVS